MYRIIAFLLTTIAIFFAVGYAGYDYGYKTQKLKDQVIFDQVNKEREEQKQEAAILLASLQQKIIEAQAESAKFKNQLEKQRAQHNDNITALRIEYATGGLFFEAPVHSGCGRSGGSTGGSQGDPSSACPTSRVQLPDSIAADLRQLVYEADKLAVEYETCYNYVNH